jgi:methionine sulfoxide reductase heme-binding subunit
MGSTLTSIQKLTIRAGAKRRNAVSASFSNVHLEIQWLRRTGRLPVQRHGPSKELLMPRRIAIFKFLVFFTCLVPLARLGWKAFHDGLGANPVEVIPHSTGTWTLVLLLLTLSISPVRKLSGALWLIRFRRVLGLYAFFYGLLHFTTNIWLDKFFDIHEMVKDIYKRPFITVGFTAFVLLIPLAVTSTQRMIRRLGRRWHMLHQLVYASTVLGAVHYLWLVKADRRVRSTAGFLHFYCCIASDSGLRLDLWFDWSDVPERLPKYSRAAIAPP